MSILDRVEKPGRYAGGELNSVVKTDAEVDFALCFADVYEVGMAMRVRREIIRTVSPDDDGMFVVDVSEALADFIISRNNANQAVLPHYERAHFYIRSQGNAHPEQIIVTRASDKKALSGTQVFC